MANAVYERVRVAEFCYIGCFKEAEKAEDRIFHFRLDNKVLTVDSCRTFALRNGYNTFALRNDGECWLGNNTPYDRLGLETDPAKCPPLGGPWTNQVYLR